MRQFRNFWFNLAAVIAAVGWLAATTAQAQDDADTKLIHASDEKLVAAFNAGKSDEIAALFLPNGELVDEDGTIYQGRKEIEELLKKFFAKFPGAQLTIEVESIRIIGPVAIEEGTRYTTTKEQGERSQVRYTAVRTKVGKEWPIVSIRDANDDDPPTPNEQLQPLAWLVGEWINEGSDMAVKIKYRWDDEKNFLLGDFDIRRGGEVIMKSSHRIGWDPLAGKVRSWMFDSDGGYADATWTLVEDAWVMKSSAVTPEGETGSATVTIRPKDKDRFVMHGTERIIGDARADDFEITVVRPPPAPSK
jgi:uncharacterized protein (TIGR02246 family)